MRIEIWKLTLSILADEDTQYTDGLATLATCSLVAISSVTDWPTMKDQHPPYFLFRMLFMSHSPSWRSARHRASVTAFTGRPWVKAAAMA